MATTMATTTTAPLSKKILVIGATGVIGRVLLAALLNGLEHGYFEQVGLLTSAATAAAKAELLAGFAARGAVVHTGDIDSEADVLAVYKDYDTVVSAVGRTAIAKQVELITLAERSDTIVRFVPSEFGTDIAYDATSATERPHQAKRAVRAFLQSDAVRRLRYTFVVTGPFADLFAGRLAAEPRAGSFDVAARAAVLVGDDGGHTPVGMTTVADVGRALVAVLRHPAAADNRAVRVHSFVASPAQLLAEFARQTERPWSVALTSLDELRRLEADAWAAAHPLAGIFTLRRIWAEGRTLYAETDNAAVGLDKTDTLEMVVQMAIHTPQEAFQSGPL